MLRYRVGASYEVGVRMTVDAEDESGAMKKAVEILEEHGIPEDAEYMHREITAEYIKQGDPIPEEV